MDTLGGYREIGLSLRWAAGGLFLGALCLVAALERLQYGLRENDGSRWWASNGRDVLNLFAFGVLSYGLHLLGFFGPTMFLLAGVMVVLLTAVQGTLGSGSARSWMALGLTVAVGLPALVAPSALAALARMAIVRLAP